MEGTPKTEIEDNIASYKIPHFKATLGGPLISLHVLSISTDLKVDWLRQEYKGTICFN